MVVSTIFYFHPYLGKISNLTNIFQMGCFNHQPDEIPLKWVPFFGYMSNFSELRTVGCCGFALQVQVGEVGYDFAAV